MKEWRRVLSCFLAVLLTVYLVPVQVMAEDLGDLWPPTTENVVDAPAGRGRDTGTTGRKSEGVPAYQRYKAGGNLSGGSTLPKKMDIGEEIDNRLLPSAAQDGETVYRNAAGMWNVSVPAELNTANGITVSRSGYTCDSI